MNEGNSFGYYVGILIVFCAILFLAWLTTKFVGKRVVGDKRAKRMKIVESLPLGLERNLLLVQVGEKFYLIASSRSRTDFMSEVEPGELPKDLNEGTSEFKSLLERYSGLGSRQTTTDKNNDEVSHIQTGVRRMKNLRQNKDSD